MKRVLSDWSKAVRKALIDKDMGIEELATNLGLSRWYVSMVVNDRYNSSEIRKRIDDYLGLSSE